MTENIQPVLTDTQREVIWEEYRLREKYIQAVMDHGPESPRADRAERRWLDAFDHGTDMVRRELGFANQPTIALYELAGIPPEQVRSL